MSNVDSESSQQLQQKSGCVFKVYMGPLATAKAKVFTLQAMLFPINKILRLSIEYSKIFNDIIDI